MTEPAKAPPSPRALIAEAAARADDHDAAKKAAGEGVAPGASQGQQEATAKTGDKTMASGINELFDDVGHPGLASDVGLGEAWAGYAASKGLPVAFSPLANALFVSAEFACKQVYHKVGGFEGAKKAWRELKAAAEAKQRLAMVQHMRAAAPGAPVGPGSDLGVER